MSVTRLDPAIATEITAIMAADPKGKWPNPDNYDVALHVWKASAHAKVIGNADILSEQFLHFKAQALHFSDNFLTWVDSFFGRQTLIRLMLTHSYRYLRWDFNLYLVKSAIKNNDESRFDEYLKLYADQNGCHIDRIFELHFLLFNNCKPSILTKFQDTIIPIYFENRQAYHYNTRDNGHFENYVSKAISLMSDEGFEQLTDIISKHRNPYLEERCHKLASFTIDNTKKARDKHNAERAKTLFFAALHADSEPVEMTKFMLVTLFGKPTIENVVSTKDRYFPYFEAMASAYRTATSRKNAFTDLLSHPDLSEEQRSYLMTQVA